MVYPLLWMVSATFKSNAEIFSTVGLFTSSPTMSGYYKAVTMNYSGDINIWKAMLNTYSYVIPKVVFTVISATLTAYGFGRFKFKDAGFICSSYVNSFSACRCTECAAVHTLYKVKLG